MSKRSFTREIWPERIAGLQQSETFRLPIDTARYKAREISKAGFLSLVENWRQLPDLHEGRISVSSSLGGYDEPESSLREDPQFVSSVPTGNKRKLKQDE